MDLIASYLMDRSRFVRFNKHSSSREIIKYGVPQDSVLGPLHFVPYMYLIFSDIVNFHRGFNLILFADDTTAYRSYNQRKYTNYFLVRIN